MATNEGLQPVSNDQVPIDPNVRIPDHVRRASEQAEAFYKQPPAEPEPVAPAADAAPQTVHEEAPPAAEPAPPPPPADDNLPASEWRNRYLSMKGRYDKATQTIGSMEQQMSELGQELIRTQQMVAQPQPRPQHHEVSQPNHNDLITDEDRANYGDELIDLARRAALSTVSPQLDELREENKRLTNKVSSTAKRELFMTLDQKLPQWRQINNDVRFITWLRLPNVYTGRVRKAMLDEAVNGANAPTVLQFFRDFLTEAQATGNMAPAPQTEQQPAPRTAAVALETLAAPGRARPASGDNQTPTEKPFYSRAQISQLYRDKQRGHYAGREADFAAAERDLEAAQREGRIRG